MPVTGSLIAGGANLLGGVISGLFGSSQKKKGQKLLDNTPYPTETVPSEITQLASTGMPSEQYNQAMRNIQRQQLMSLRGANDRRGGLITAGTNQQATNDATLNLDAQNAQQKAANMRSLASWKDKAWQWNVANKYNQDRQYAMGLIGSGNQNIVGGIDKGIAGLARGAYGLFGSGGGGRNNGFNDSGYATGVPGVGNYVNSYPY